MAPVSQRLAKPPRHAWGKDYGDLCATCCRRGGRLEDERLSCTIQGVIMSSGPRRVSVATLVAVLVAVLPCRRQRANRPTGTPGHGARRNLQRVAQPVQPGRPGERPVDAGRRAGQRIAEIIQRVRPDVLLSTSSTTTRRAATCSATTTWRCRTTAPPPIEYVRYIARQHRRCPTRGRPRQRRSARRPGDAFGFGVFPGQFGMLVLSQLPHRDDERAHVPGLPVAGHARRVLPDDPRDRRPGLLRRGRTRRRSGCRRRATGTCRSRSAAGPCTCWPPPDAAGVRRPRGPERPPQPRRDPVLGRLRHPAGATTSTTTTGHAVASRRASRS